MMQTTFNDPELVKEFIQETGELLGNLDNDFICLESDPHNGGILDRIFRAVHTIKGTSSFLGFHQLVELGHATEDILQTLRTSGRAITSDVMDILLKAVDKIKILIEQIQNKDVKPIDLTEILASLEKIKLSGDRNALEWKQKRTSEDKKEEQKSQRDVIEKRRTLPEVYSSTIRVDVERLDDLMNLVGELILERNRLLQINREFRVSRDVAMYSEKVMDATEKIHSVTNELQLSILKTRMIPIDRLFRKFPRMVRDIAREKKKEVDLVISGSETELDKTVMDHLGDPLIHILRNAIDHGIEPCDVREKIGKTRRGRIQLSASQEGNHILITVQDDGNGIDIEKVKQKAVEKKLVSSEQLQTMGSKDIVQFVFEPGFSTAEKVSDLSGRGVGMDVVKTNIRNLNGMIDLQSEPLKGTTIVLKIPFTLAVIQALMVQAAGDVYALPLTSVIETFRIRKDDIKTLEQGEVVCHRDSVIPLFYLKRLLNPETGNIQENKNGSCRYVVFIGVAEKRFGLGVDRLLGQEEVVVKSLGEYLGNVSGIVGSTIMGDGRVRLIVDCSTVADMTQQVQIRDNFHRKSINERIIRT